MHYNYHALSHIGRQGMLRRQISRALEHLLLPVMDLDECGHQWACGFRGFFLKDNHNFCWHDTTFQKFVDPSNPNAVNACLLQRREARRMGPRSFDDIG
jgi:hypothetical protein